MLICELFWLFTVVPAAFAADDAVAAGLAWAQALRGNRAETTAAKAANHFWAERRCLATGCNIDGGGQGRKGVVRQHSKAYLLHWHAYPC